ncbi:MAG: sulfatase-like hydrolase/transferase, partial [Nocardioides sp.]
MRIQRKAASAIVAALTAALLGGHGVASPLVDTAEARPAAPDPRPNIVLILMDDFSLELLATMPQARRMQLEGATYQNAFVIDSLCCPSRAALFTGQTPHQTGVLTNTPNDPENPIGGVEAFWKYGNAERSFNVGLENSGYTTGFIGKYV